MSICLARLAMATWVCVAVPLAAVAQNDSQGTSPGPRLVPSETEHDLGRLDPHDRQRSVQVTIRNTGDRPLVIRKVRTTCLCLRADPSAVTIPQGGETMLRLQINPPAIDESIDEEVLIYSNDPVRPVSKIRLSGSVGTAIRLLPQQAIAVGPAYRGDLAQARFAAIQLVAADGASLGQIRLVPSHPAIRPQVRKLDDGSYRLEITIDQTIPLGPLNESIRVETEHPSAPVVEVPVLGLIVGDFDSGGRRIDFGFIKEGQQASVTFLLGNRGNTNVEIVRAEGKLPVPSRVEVTREDKLFKIVVRIGPAPAFTQLGGTLELHTDNPAEPLVRLQVSGGVLAKQPFEQVAADGSDARFMAIIKNVLARGEGIPADRFFSDVLGGVKDQRAIAVLLRALTEGSLPARMRAVQLLGEFRTPEVIQGLRDAITDDQEPFVRRMAVAAYAEAASKAAVPVLLTALQDNDSWVREDAATYLGKIGDPRAIPALRGALGDPDPEAAGAVRDALISLQAGAK